MTFFEVKNLSKSYGNYKALNNVSFKVQKGEIVALIGKNGAGKTTFLKSISGDIYPDCGEIVYKNKDLLKDNSYLSEFGILIQAIFLDYLNAQDNLKLLLKASGIQDKYYIKNRVNEVLELVGLEEKKKAYVKSFSFGMKQRLGLAQALLHPTEFLILDEPFVGLDPLGKDILKDVIKKKAREDNGGIIFSSHDLYDVNEICDRIVMFDKGKKIFDGKFDFKNTYKIYIQDTIEDKFKNILIDKFKNKVSIGKSIEFIDSTIINDVIELIYDNKLKILDFQTEKSSLNDFFRNEVNYEK